MRAAHNFSSLSASATCRIPGRSPIFKIEQTKRRLAEDLRALIRTVSMPASMREDLDPDEKYAVSKRLKLVDFFTNVVGRMILKNLGKTFQDALGKRDLGETALRALQTLFT